MDDEKGYRKLTITDTTGAVVGLSANTRYHKLDRQERPKAEARVGDVVVNERSTYGNVVLLEGMTKKLYVDETGRVYDRKDVKFYDSEGELPQKSQTKTFEITDYQPVSAYTDMYVIDKYYELSADDNGVKKDFDKDVARRANLVGMRKLWEYLDANRLVARGEFNTSSRGFVSSDGYIRAIKFGDKWTLEVGVFREEKVFRYLQEGVPTAADGQAQGAVLKPVRKLKFV